MPLMSSSQPQAHRSRAFTAFKIMVIAMMFTFIIWENFFPGRSSPDSQHTVPIQWRGGAVTYRSPREDFLLTVLWYGGLGGVAAGVLFQMALSYYSRRRSGEREKESHRPQAAEGERAQIDVARLIEEERDRWPG